MSRNSSRSLTRLFPARAHGHAGRPSGPRRGRRLWSAEALEDRRLLAATVYTVDLTTDNGPASTGTGSGTTGDLRYCIDQANANQNTDGSLIRFDRTVFGTPQTITLSASLGTLNLSETAGPEVIRGPGEGLLTVSGGHHVGVLSVSRGVKATLTDLTISDGSAARGGGLSIDGGTVALTHVAV